MKTSIENGKHVINDLIDEKSEDNYSGVVVLVVNMHCGGISKIDIMGNRESLDLNRSKD